MSSFAQSTPVNRAPRQLSVQMARAPQRNPRRSNAERGGYSFTVQTPHGPRLRVNLNVVAVDRAPRAPRVEVRPVDAVSIAAVEDEAVTAARTRSSRIRKKTVCNHALDRKFCSKCHIRRRHLNRWWLQQQYRKH